MKRYAKVIAVAVAVLGIVIFTVKPQAAAGGSLLSVTEEAQVRPIQDGSGMYLLKSDGFYCLKEDGSRDNHPAVHYFKNFTIDGTVFEGYYYHDESGKFQAHVPYLAYLKNLSVSSEEGGYTADGCYMINNLGRISAAPQIRYIQQLTLNGKTYDSYYYFDENGKMNTDPGIFYISMDSNGRSFDGYYYFGENGVLASEAGTTSQGYVYDADGRIQNMDEGGIQRLKLSLQEMVTDFEGEWSIYVKDLGTDDKLVINNQRMASASLIKAFVMAETYDNMDVVTQSEENILKKDAGSKEVSKKIGTLLSNMITVSDNESFNELVRLQTKKYDFAAGARKINQYLKAEGYQDTQVLHTLAPSSTTPVGIGENNTTSVKDCGLLLEKIYREECGSRKDSQAMLELLLGQKNRAKIPQVLDASVTIANKTGETDTTQHDIAIVYGNHTDYILCVMSEKCPKEEDAIDDIRKISAMVYEYLENVPEGS